MNRLIVVLIVLGAVSSAACGAKEGPAMQEARAMTAKAEDERQAREIRDAAGPQKVRCDSGTPNLVFFDSIKNEALVFYRKVEAVDDKPARIECVDMVGYNRTYGTMYRPVSPNIVTEILDQPPPPRPRPTPQCTPTPLPVLDEGSCCPPKP